MKIVSTEYIDLRGCYYDHKYFARKLWEFLFRKFNGVAWRSYDNFLVDYQIFYERFHEQEVFYWTYNESGATLVYKFYPYEDCCRITLDDDNKRIIIEQIEANYDPA